MGDGWGLGGSPCLLSNKRVIHQLKPPAGGGESWAPSGQAGRPPRPPDITAFQDCTAVRYGATGTFSQQIF